jgi:uncharacterized protein (TIGR02996 family)
MNYREALLKGIEEYPLDEVRRNVYADYLDELGEVEEANRQRAYLAAYAKLEKIASDYDYYPRGPGRMVGDDDYEYDPAPEKDRHTFVMKLVVNWLEKPEGNEPGYFYFYFNTTEHPSSDEEKTEFFDALEVVSGKKIAQEVRSASSFYCSC